MHQLSSSGWFSKSWCKLFVFWVGVEGFQVSNWMIAYGTPPFLLTNFSLPVTLERSGADRPCSRASFASVSSLKRTTESITKKALVAPAEWSVADFTLVEIMKQQCLVV